MLLHGNELLKHAVERFRGSGESLCPDFVLAATRQPDFPRWTAMYHRITEKPKTFALHKVYENEQFILYRAPQYAGRGDT